MTKPIVLIADPRVLAIPILENHEALIDLRDQSEILFGPSPEIEDNHCYMKMRQSVYNRLLDAQKVLPSHLRICLYEALRTLSLQKKLFEKMWKRIQSNHPNWNNCEIYNEVIKLASPVTTIDGTPNIPPHSTGAAVDVYLIDSETFLPVEMGILVKDWMQDTDGTLSCTDSPALSEEAKNNRSILCQAMESAGFVNCPTEYWHWSFGDRYWAFSKNESQAFYGPVADH